MQLDAPIRRNGVLVEVPTVTLRGPNDHRIEIIGVLHIADRAFWHYLNTRLELLSRMRWAVNYEMVRMTKQDQRRLRFMTASSNFLAKRAKRAGLVPQTNGFSLPLFAKNTDLPGSVLARMVKRPGIKYWLRLSLARIILNLLPTRAFREMMAVVFTKTVTAGYGGVSGINDDIIIDLRNQVAAQACLIERQNVVTVWGAAHVQGIASLLEDKGYVVTGIQWLPVYAVNSK